VAEGRSTTVTAVSYDEGDGASGREITGGSQPAGWLAPDGKMWFSTRRGLTAIDPSVPFSALPPPVIVTGTVIDRAAPVASTMITVPAGSHSIEVHYTGLSFSAPQKLHFQYRLDGYDPSWNDAGTRRVAYYADLPPGRYRFDVRARSDKGIWSDTIASMAIHQAPFFYQTLWFRALTLMVLLAGATVAYRWRIRRISEHATHLERTVAARTNELREVNAQLADGHRQLQRAHEDAVSLLNQTLLGVCAVGGDGRVTFVNAVAREVLGCGDADAIHHPWHELLPLSPDDRQRVEALMAEPLDRRKRLPVRFQRDEGREYWMEIDVRDAPSDPSRRLLYLHDVTELFDLQRLLGGTTQFQGLIGETTTMRLLYRQVRDLAASDATVIIEGETGTGKELVARAIHELSERKSRPFIAVNCAALTESILTSQLFGHRRGAFTGAVSDQVGLFEAANAGTLLLDEIGDVSAAVQASLLRVLQEREVTRLGESRPRPIDVRVLAATHRDLQAEVAAGRFRVDLLFRLRVVHVHVPALRDRKEDIPVLVAWFLGQARSAGDTEAYEVSRGVMDLLLAYRWPGNVRELKSIVDSAALAASGAVVEVTDLSEDFVERALHPDESLSPSPALDARVRDHVQLALQRTRGNRAAAARLLGISRNTMYRRLRELQLDASDDDSAA
jgi:PAS domain S-box-containing protein